MRRSHSISLETLSAEILADLERDERVKTAEVEAVRAAQPRFRTELGQLLHKVAEELRAATDEVSWGDLATLMGQRPW